MNRIISSTLDPGAARNRLCALIGSPAPNQAATTRNAGGGVHLILFSATDAAGGVDRLYRRGRGFMPCPAGSKPVGFQPRSRRYGLLHRHQSGPYPRRYFGDAFAVIRLTPIHLPRNRPGGQVGGPENRSNYNKIFSNTPGRSRQSDGCRLHRKIIRA